MPELYTAELRLNSQPPATEREALEVLRRCGLEVAVKPEVEDLESGIWNIYLNGAQRWHLAQDGWLGRTFSPGTFVTVETP